MGSEPVSRMPRYDDGLGLWKRGDGTPIGFTCKDCSITERESNPDGRMEFVLAEVRPAQYWCVKPWGALQPALPKKYITNRCKACSRKHANYKRASQKADLLVQSNQTLNGDTHLFLVTVTVTKTDFIRRMTVEEQRKELMLRFRRMRDRSPMFKVIQGGMYGVEFKSKKGNPHPHIHMVCMIDKEALDGRGYLPKGLISMFKREAPKYKFGSVVNVRRIDKLKVDGEYRRVKPNNTAAVKTAVRYAVKYSVKEAGNARKQTGWFGIMYGNAKHECPKCLRRFCEAKHKSP